MRRGTVAISVSVLVTGLAPIDTVQADAVWWEELRTCNAVDSWIEAHVDELPATLEELSKIPPPYRRAIFAAHAPPVREQLLGEHLTAFRMRHSSLTHDQQVILDEVHASLHGLVTGDLDDEDRSALSDRVATHYAGPLLYEGFATIGPPGGADTRTMPICNCKRDTIFSCNSITGPDMVCLASGCLRRDIGCGFLLLQPCDGDCRNS